MARKTKRPRLTPQTMPESVISEVRALRSENAPEVPDRGHDRSYSCTDHTLACSICGEVGNHPCLPVLYEALEASPDFADACWEAFKQLEERGHFVVEGASELINLEGVF